ncbi:YrhB domain-containing protein [Saccharopolyspora rosea]|uniref:YrhB domain-containing protein n=1 Tax=Saccharopolyspora rosea TaxID=524884 RepID=UPI0021DA8BF6|nr:YrhB domain-containing protein [Saccharopolyspora rosea]
MMSDDLGRRAAEWLDRTYGGLVTLTDGAPLVDGERTQLFGCDYASGSQEPLLAATIAVPKDGGEPFPVANAAPLDEEFNASVPPGADPQAGLELWRWRVNARGCLIATHAAVDRTPATALPWRPLDEAPGWWERMLDAHFPDAEVATCSTWGDVTSMLAEGEPGTRAVVWLRRQLSGVEITGHLLYAFNDGERAAFLDGQQGALARLDDDEVSQLVVARFQRPVPGDSEMLPLPWEIAAPDLDAARDKATSWLEQTFEEPVVLVRPDQEDEIERGWLFACTTQRFQDSGDWRDQMLDAAVVVPKEAGAAPFPLPNSDPWRYLKDWEAGQDGLPDPPAPTVAAWFESTIRELGQPLSSSEHRGWSAALEELSQAPEGAESLVWVRRTDARGRETVGNLLVAVKQGSDVRLIDSMAEDGQPTFDQDPMAVHVVRYR